MYVSMVDLSSGFSRLEYFEVGGLVEPIGALVVGLVCV